MKKILFAFLAVMAIAFVSCEPQNQPSKPSGGSSVSNGTLTVRNTGSQKVFVTIAPQGEAMIASDYIYKGGEITLSVKAGTYHVTSLNTVNLALTEYHPKVTAGNTYVLGVN